MNTTGCKHIRFRNNVVHNIDVEDFIKSIEINFDIDFRSLPEWKNLIRGWHKTSTVCKQKIRDANFRKLLIINKIYIQWCRPSPFTLTDNLARTSGKWHKIKKYDKKLNTSVPSDLSFLSNITLSDEEFNGASETAHPNTEIVPSKDIILEEKIKMNAKTNVHISESLPEICLPIFVRTNLHKDVSPLNSKDSFLSGVTVISYKEKPEIKELEWLLVDQTLAVKCFPKRLVIEETSLNEQYITFSLKNCISEPLNVRFTCVTDKSAFKKIKVIPVIPIRLYPGVGMFFKFIFILSQNTDDFISSIYFKVGRRFSETTVEALCIPIVSKFDGSRLVSVSEIVIIPPVYIWQVKYGYLKTAVTVLIGDKNNYDVHITKRIVNCTTDESKLSVEAIAPNTESIEDRMVDSEIEYESKILASSTELHNDVETIDSIDITSSVLEEIVDRSLDSFMFEKTHLYVKSQSKRKVYVMFTKAERIGKHQSYYDFEFYDPETRNFILRKTAKIFAEVLPHPIQIYPTILDMSDSLINHGFCKDIFTITNTHKMYPAMIKIKLTTKMHKIFSIKPTEVVIPTKSSVSFEVKFCSSDLSSVNRPDDLVHFTVKIIVSGHKLVYDNVPPFFYEIIAPCALEFKKIYNDKYYKEIIDKSSEDTNDLKNSLN